MVGAHEDAAGARQALDGRTGLKRGYGFTVYSSALPWIFTAYGTSPSARASTTGPITRWLASATSGRTRSATSRTAATLAST